MSENGMNTLLTGNGLGIRLEDIVGIPKKEFDNFGSLVDISLK